jgi:hypothetical protein
MPAIPQTCFSFDNVTDLFSAAEAPTSTTPATEETGGSSSESSNDMHFHGCLFNETEAEQLALIFYQKQRKAHPAKKGKHTHNNSSSTGANNNNNNNNADEISTIPFSEVESFLQVYWGWQHSEHNPVRQQQQQQQQPQEQTAFPSTNLEALRARVIGSNNNNNSTNEVTLRQFLEIFFLFDNQTPNTPCQHGQKERVKVCVVFMFLEK